MELAASLPLAWKMRRGARQADSATGRSTICCPLRSGPVENGVRRSTGTIGSGMNCATSPMMCAGRHGAWPGLFREESVAELIRQHEASEFDHAYRLWGVLFLNSGWREWCDFPIQSAHEKR